MVEFFNWLYPFDSAILTFTSELARWGGAFFTPLSKIFTFLGEGGILYFITAFVLALFKNTRKSKSYF